MYADDVSININENCEESLLRSCSQIFSSMSAWCSTNDFSLNIKKCSFISFRTSKNLSSFSLEQCAVVKLLGLRIDQQLGWVEQVDHICKKLLPLSFVFRRLRHICSRHILLALYFGQVYPHLSYGALFWGTARVDQVQRVFKVQKRIIRAMNNVGHRDSCRPLFKSLAILTVPSIIIYEAASYVKLHSSDFLMTGAVHSYETRHGNNTV